MGMGNGRGGWIRTNACQDQNLVPYRLATPLYSVSNAFDLVSDAYRRRLWQGRLDSNQRMPGSKPGALPLGDAPVSYNRMLSIHFLACAWSLRCSIEMLRP